jgi:UTP--glucose-1-phosphate uridylyltransferase
MQIESAVIPVAGIGSRAFPLTTSIEKCLLPVYAGVATRPLIDYMVQDCVKAGIKRILFVTTERGKTQLKDYFCSINTSVSEQLSSLGKNDILQNELNRRSAMNVTFEFIIQPQGLYGTAVPLFYAQDALRGENSFVMFGGDDFVYHPDSTSELGLAIDTWTKSKTNHLIMGAPVSRQAAQKYGVLYSSEQKLLTSIDEKPKLLDIPKNPLVNITRYLFNKSIWAEIEEEINVQRGNGEHYITYAINEAIRKGQTFAIHTVKGIYLDGGSYEGLQQAGEYISNHLPLSARE